MKSLLIIPPPGDKAIINTLVTIQSFFYIFMFIFFKNEICTVCTLKAFKLSISVMGLWDVQLYQEMDSGLILSNATDAVCVQLLRALSNRMG